MKTYNFILTFDDISNECVTLVGTTPDDCVNDLIGAYVGHCGVAKQVTCMELL